MWAVAWCGVWVLDSARDLRLWQREGVEEVGGGACDIDGCAVFLVWDLGLCCGCGGRLRGAAAWAGPGRLQKEWSGSITSGY